MKSFIVVLPARIGSKRLHAKPLIKIAGLPMIIRTYFQCLKAVNKKLVYVATDSVKIKKVCDFYGAQCLLTSKKCLTGTDRVAEVSKKIRAKFYINVQGDEPFFNPSDIKKLIKYAKKNPKSIINGYTKITDKKLFYSQSIPKVVFDKNQNLIYMSRAPIPSNKKKNFKLGWRQICAYSFPITALKIFYSFKKKPPIESIEDIEILRFLENGIKVKMIEMSNKSIAIDSKDDLDKAKIYLKTIKN
jgi:3-deoxy-manno-octulosonate cytidylyltransferase (CMP-KDO synthetase)